MAKYAYVATKWIGTGTQEDPQRPDIPEGYTRCEDVTGQFVHLAEGSPDPNVVVVKIEESRSKHDGYLESLKGMAQYPVLDEWEEIDGVVGEKSKVKPDNGLRTWLLAAGLSAEQCDEVAQPDRTEKLVTLARTFGRGSQQEEKIIEH